jgi:hypothetical protein
MGHKNNGRKPEEEKIAWPRPVVAIPMERTISYADKVFWPFLAIAQQGWPFIRFNYGRTDLVRNKYAQHLLASHFTHLVMLDVDHIHPDDIVQRLMSNFVENPDLKVVGGLNFRRGEPFEPCAFVRGDDGTYYSIADWERGSLMKVDAVGTGSIAIAREVFEMMEPPWFWNDYSRAMDDAWPGEDMGFSANCQKLGIEMYVDTRITSPHLIDAVVDELAFLEYQKEKGLKGIPPEMVIASLKEPKEQ